MERKEILVSAEERARQKEFSEKVRALSAQRTRAPLALVDTFGCQQNVADGEMLMGLLKEMGYEMDWETKFPGHGPINTIYIKDHSFGGFDIHLKQRPFPGL